MFCKNQRAAEVSAAEAARGSNAPAGRPEAAFSFRLGGDACDCRPLALVRLLTMTSWRQLDQNQSLPTARPLEDSNRLSHLGSVAPTTIRRKSWREMIPTIAPSRTTGMWSMS